MSTIDQNILTTLKKDFAKILKTNSYNHDLTNISYMLLFNDDVNSYPFVSYTLGEGINDSKWESGNMWILAVDILLHCQIANDSSKSGKLTDEFELWKQDVKNLFSKQTINYTTKTELSQISGVVNYWIEGIYPYLDYNADNNSGTIFFKLKIEYLETL